MPTALIDAFAQTFSGFEMRDMFSRQRNGFAGFGIATHPRRTVVQREAAEPANFYSVPTSQTATHDRQDVLYR